MLQSARVRITSYNVCYTKLLRLHVTCNLPAPEYALTVMEIVPGNLAGGGHVEYPEPFIALY